MFLMCGLSGLDVSLSCFFPKIFSSLLELKRDFDSLKPSSACKPLPSWDTLMLFDSTVSVFVLTVVGAADYTRLPKLKST